MWIKNLLRWRPVSIIRFVAVLFLVGINTACGWAGPRDNFPDFDNLVVPRSVKGYELYIWEQGGVLSFTLISGTNRIKEFDEIVSLRDELSPDGWFKMTVRGLTNGMEMVRRLPPGETLFLMELPGLDAKLDAGDYLPPSPDVIHRLEEICRDIGVQLLLTTAYGTN